MAAPILSILTPSVVTKIISTIHAPGSVLSKYFGFGIGGPNVQSIPGKTYTYDIYDNVRAVARGRIPGAASGQVALNPVGNVSVTLAKSAEKIGLDYNTLLQIRTLGANAGTRDVMGKRYVENQLRTLRQRQDNFREFVTAGALCYGGAYGFYQSGDDLIPTLATSGTFISVDHRIPSTHKLIGGAFAAGLDLGTGSNQITATWATTTNDIVAMLLAVSRGLVRSVGSPLAKIIVGSKVWANVIANNSVKNAAGSSNTPFASWDNPGTKNPDGSDAGVFRAVLRGLPQFEWIIVDNTIQCATTDASTIADVPVVPDDYAVFMIEPTGSWFQMVEGSEIIKDNDLAPPVEREGFYSWLMEKADPARFEAHALQSVGLEINTPKGIAVARVQ